MARSPVRPEAWIPPKDPGLTGPYAINDALAAIERWEVPGSGPEDVVLDLEGRLHCGLADGRILRFPAGGGPPETIADTGGRPLGLEFDNERRLVVCDAERGLLRVVGDAVETLVSEADGRPLTFTNNAAVGSDGTIFFSDSSARFGLGEYRLDLLEHSGTGRLLAYRPDGATEVLIDGLYFANGVALADDESFVLVAETGRYRITRLWMAGPRAGETDRFIENLPGIPDNLSSNGRGTIWLAVFTPRNRPLDRLLPRPRLRRLVAMLPESIQPQPVRHSFVLGFDQFGDVTRNLQDPRGVFAPITGVREHDGELYLGSLTEAAVGRVALH